MAPTATEHKRLPRAPEAEREVIGAIALLPEEVMRLALPIVGPADFFETKERAVFTVMCELHAAGLPIDGAMIRDRLVDSPDFGPDETVASYLLERAQEVATAANAGYYARQIKEASSKRRLFAIADAARDAALNGQASTDVYRSLIADLDDWKHEAAADKPKYQAISAAELATSRYDLSYIIDRVLVDRQPCIIGGPKKSLKTSIAVDLALSIATGGYFLGKFPVPNPRRVLLCSAESGLATLQETALRVCRVIGRDLADVDGLVIAEALPKLLNAVDLADFARFVDDVAPDVVILDPLYRMHSGDGAESVFKMGNPLAELGELCLSHGATPIVCHHLKTSRTNQFAPAELDDLAYAGCAEYFRQWFLLSRREQYEPGTGAHRLWLTVGGSSGHNSSWAVDIDEGTLDDPGGRRWSAAIHRADEARDAEQERKEQARTDRLATQREADKRAILQAVAGCDGHQGTKTGIRDRSGVRTQRFDSALADLFRDGELRSVEIVKSNGRKYEGFALKANQ